MDLPAQHGFKRRRKRCSTESEAKGLCKEWTKDLAQNGLGTPLDRADLDWLRYWRSKMSLDAMDEALRGYAVSNSVQLGAVFQEYCVDLNARAGRKEISSHHSTKVRSHIAKFVNLMGHKTPLADITVQHVTDWINGLGLEPRGLNNHRASLVSLLRWAYLREYVTKDLGKLIPGVKLKPSDPGIYTPQAIRALIGAAEGPAKVLIALGAYAGLRTAELMRICWEDIKGGELYVRRSKRDKDRWVKIEPVLAALLPEPGQEGLVYGKGIRTWHRHLEEVMKKAGVEFVENGLRHSFASHHLVHFGNAPQTAAEMGHETPRITFNYYRQAVTREQAREYWEG